MVHWNLQSIVGKSAMRRGVLIGFAPQARTKMHAWIGAEMPAKLAQKHVGGGGPQELFFANFPMFSGTITDNFQLDNSIVSCPPFFQQAVWKLYTCRSR